MMPTITGKYKIYTGEVEEICTGWKASHFDACLCDPPYLLQFMGKEFDRQHRKEKGKNEGQKMQAWHERWTREVLRVLKPGAHMLAFGGTRTYHRLASAAEDVGFEVRDMLSWAHGQGFPKGKSQLKPAHEPVVLARKPGNGELNIDECRITISEEDRKIVDNRSGAGFSSASVPFGIGRKEGEKFKSHSGGRWPANLILSHHPGCERVGERKVKANQTSKPGSGAGYAATDNHGIYGKGKGGVAKVPTADADGMETVEVWECHPDCPIRILDGQSGISTSGIQRYPNPRSGGGLFKTKRGEHPEGPQYGDSGGASRFFYCAKVSTRERNLGGIDCRHPTLKPISLTTYLARLLLPPSRADKSPRRVLVPFSGAGSEVIGALLAGWDQVIGIEMDSEYVSWSRARIKAVRNGEFKA